MFTTPVSLLERIRSSPSTQAWDRFVDLYSPLLYSWAHRLRLDEHDVADLVQDVFATLVEVLPLFDYDARRSFRAWLKTVLMNAWRKNQARAARTRTTGHGLPADVPDTDPRMELDEAEYRRRLVARALQLMQVDFEATTWKACWEFLVEGRDPEAIARDLGISVNAVYLAKSRVLRHLRVELQGLLDE